MKLMCTFLCLSLFFIGCKDANEKPTANEEKTSVDDVFKKNSETVMANLKGWQNENVDYSMYADDFVMLDTGFGTETDSVSLKEMMDHDKVMWQNYDFKLLTDPPVLLPGVNSETKLPDGSVRHYSNWEVTRVATDSVPEKTAVIRLYESFDFNEDGKIIYQQTYGDFSGIMMHFEKKEDEKK